MRRSEGGLQIFSVLALCATSQLLARCFAKVRLHRPSACEAYAAASTPATCRSSPFGSAKKAGPVP